MALSSRYPDDERSHRIASPLGIAVQDHIIVGKCGHASLKAMKLIWQAAWVRTAALPFNAHKKKQTHVNELTWGRFGLVLS